MASIVKQNSINLMFAIEEKGRELYKNLADLIDGARVGLKKNRDITNMITEMYRVSETIFLRCLSTFKD